VLEGAAGYLDFAIGCAIDHVVEGRRHMTEEFL